MHSGRAFLLLLSLLTLAACSDTEPSVIRMGLASAPLNLDPRYATDATSERVNRLLYQRLVEFDAQGRAIPGAADWVRLSPQHYRFQLNDSAAEFGPGDPLGVEDIIATYRFVLDPDNASPLRESISLVERLEPVDERTFDLYIERPDPLLPAYLTLNLLPADLLASQHPFASRPVGSGPFRMVDASRAASLLLERRVDGQLFRLMEVKNPTVRALKLLRGEIDLLQNDLSPELLDYLRKAGEGSHFELPGNNFTYQ